MPKSYVLVDLENVKPKSFEPLKHPDFQVHVFIGANQKSLQTEIVTALQSLKASGNWVQITGNGKNALDFHITYYAGLLSAQDSDATFYFVSKDKGFDPLVNHLNSIGTKASRVADINRIPVLENFSGNTVHDKVEKIAANLKSRGKSVPKKKTSLCNAINSLFGKPLKQAELDNIIGRMKNLEILKVEDEKVSFDFGKT